MKKIKAILFDMDGVLLDAKEWHYLALKKAIQIFGFDINRYDHVMKYDGLPTKKKLEYFSQEYNLPHQLHPLINQLKQEFTIDLIQEYAKPNFIHKFALSKLKSDGYKLALCSNSIRNTIELSMRKTKLIDYFDLVLSNEDVIKPKPDPEIYLTAINKLELSPEECLIVEDNENGIKAAIDSGAHLFKVSFVEDVKYKDIVEYIKEVNNK